MKGLNVSLEKWKIIQFGPPRTASTLQHKIISAYLCACDVNVENLHIPKYHTDDYQMKTYPASSIVFVSTNKVPTVEKGRDMIKSELERKIGGPIAYLQFLSDVRQKGYLIALDYASLFQANEAQVDAVLQYMKFWDILRLCCGPQMASDYRYRLYHNVTSRLMNKDDQTHRSSSLKKGSLHSYDACEIYNIDQVESSLLGTDLIRKCPESNVLQLELLAVRVGWSKVGNHFCLDYINAAKEANAAFNVNPFRNSTR